MRIGRKLIDEIVAHSREEDPNECCGMVAGAGGRATRVYRARNAFESPLRYEVHPRDQLRIMEEIEESGEELAAIYHSHTRSAATPPRPTSTWRRTGPIPLYLICSLAEGHDPIVRGFAIRDGDVEEVDLVVE